MRCDVCGKEGETHNRGWAGWAYCPNCWPTRPKPAVKTIGAIEYKQPPEQWSGLGPDPREVPKALDCLWRLCRTLEARVEILDAAIVGLERQVEALERNRCQCPVE